MSEKLKPCPFCGGEARMDFEYQCYVTCRACGGRATGTSKEEAAKRWNSRVQPQESPITGEKGEGNINPCQGKEKPTEGENEAVETSWPDRYWPGSPQAVLPEPCTNVKAKTVKDWFAKIDEELNEFKEDVLLELGSKADADTRLKNVDISQFETVKKWHNCIAEEAADTITAITSMLEAMGIKEDARQEAQRRVNAKNKERGRL